MFCLLTRSCIDTTDAIRRETEGLKPEKDKDLQREVHNDPQRLELVAGNTVDGFTKMHTEVSRTQARTHANKNKRTCMSTNAHAYTHTNNAFGREHVKPFQCESSKKLLTSQIIA